MDCVKGGMPAKSQSLAAKAQGVPGRKSVWRAAGTRAKGQRTKWANRRKLRDAKPWGLRRISAMPARPLIMKSKPRETAGRKAKGAKARQRHASPAAD